MSFIWITLMLGMTVLLSLPLGRAMASAMQPAENGGGFRHRIEIIIGKIGGKVSEEQHNWKQYCIAMLIFNAAMFVLVFAILSLQKYLPLNPDGQGFLNFDLIFNTTASFVTNTNLQHYSGEASMSYFSQVFALMWLQFVSAATGIAALAALARGLSGSAAMGNYYKDLLRAAFLILLPLAVIVAIALVLMGVPMTLKGSVIATGLEGVTQTIARGPVAAFVAINELLLFRRRLIVTF